MAAILVALAWGAGPAARQPKPNIIMIMGDDIGWANIGAYNQGIMSGRRRTRPAGGGGALHRLLRRGQLHGRPGELHHWRAADPHRHDHGRPAGSPIGIPAQAPTIATALKSMGYATASSAEPPG